MFPLTGTSALLLAPVFGFAFGWLLHRGRVTSYDVIVNQLRLRDFTVLKIMLTAIIVGGIGVYVLVDAGLARWALRDANIGGVILGGLLFGVGMALYGYCPGTGLAAMGTGQPACRCRCGRHDRGCHRLCLRLRLAARHRARLVEPRAGDAGGCHGHPHAGDLRRAPRVRPGLFLVAGEAGIPRRLTGLPTLRITGAPAGASLGGRCRSGARRLIPLALGEAPCARRSRAGWRDGRAPTANSGTSRTRVISAAAGIGDAGRCSGQRALGRDPSCPRCPAGGLLSRVALARAYSRSWHKAAGAGPPAHPVDGLPPGVRRHTATEPPPSLPAASRPAAAASSPPACLGVAAAPGSGRPKGSERLGGLRHRRHMPRHLHPRQALAIFPSRSIRKVERSMPM